MNDEFQRTCIRSYVDQDKINSLRRDLANNRQLAKNADTFAMLGDLTRLRILYYLSKAGELCVCDLSDILGMGVSAISHQLRKLKDRNLVKNRREGLTIYYSLSDGEEAKSACDLLKAMVANVGIDSTAILEL